MTTKLIVNTETHYVSSSHEGGTGKYEGYDTEVINVELLAVSLEDKEGGMWLDSIDILAEEDVEAGDKVYIVEVIYADGGTFGETRGYSTLVYATKDLERAREAEKNPEKFVNYVSWRGYFAELMDKQIHCFTVQETYDSNEKGIIVH